MVNMHQCLLRLHLSSVDRSDEKNIVIYTLYNFFKRNLLLGVTADLRGVLLQRPPHLPVLEKRVQQATHERHRHTRHVLLGVGGDAPRNRATRVTLRADDVIVIFFSTFSFPVEVLYGVEKKHYTQTKTNAIAQAESQSSRDRSVPFPPPPPYRVGAGIEEQEASAEHQHRLQVAHNLVGDRRRLSQQEEGGGVDHHRQRARPQHRAVQPRCHRPV